MQQLESRRLLNADGAALQVLSDHDDSSVLVRFHPQAQFESDDDTTSLLPGLQQRELPEGLDVAGSVAFFRNHPGVLYAEPNYEVRIAATPNDVDYDALWGLNNTGQTGGTADADIDAQEAWDFTTGSSSTIVAVVDTGVDYLHPDLAGNMWVNVGEIAGDGVDNDGNGFVDDVHGYNFVSNNGDPRDDHDHGTHVAGTIGASANNGIGVAGINWDVQIMAVKFLDARGSGSIANAVSAIQYAVDNGATISNHSWGFNGAFSQALSDSIEYARQRDHVFVAAAGNGGGDRIGDDNDVLPFWPGNFIHDNVLSVAATDHNDQLATFSNYGLTQVDLGAPGVGILSTTIGNTYESFNGTSMATPHVAGVAALLRSEYPDWSYEQVRDRIFDTVDPVTALQSRSTTGGRLNAAAAVTPDESGPILLESAPGEGVMKPTSQIELTFDERIDVATFTSDDILGFSGPQGAIDVDSVTPIAGSSGRQFEIAFPEQTELGQYSMVIGSDIADAFGNLMDQNSNGIGGEVADRYTASFTIVPDTVGPFVVASTPSGGHELTIDRAQITFDERILASSVGLDDILSFTGPAGDITPTSITPQSTSEFEIVFPTQNVLGSYSLLLGGQIADLAGNLLDQDQDGVGGETDDDQYELNFRLEVWQYADHVIDFSSQYSSTDWSAEQALGEPDTFSYGDIDTAWAPANENGTQEFLTVGFADPVLATGVSIRETFGNGFVRAVEVRDASSGEFVTVSTQTDPSPPNVPFDYLVEWPQTVFPVDAVRISVDTDHHPNAFEEIDSVQLRGITPPDEDGARIVETSFAESVEGPVDRLTLTFDEPVQDGTFTLDDVLQFDGPDGPIAATAVDRLTSSQYELRFPAQSTFGDYTLIIGPDILDLDGLPLNQDGDSVGGEPDEDSFQHPFRIELWQFAESLIDFSSQYGATTWSAAQTLGPSDTFNYGDERTAWAPANANGTQEYVTVAFPEAVLPTSVVIRETYGNGFVSGIEIRNSETGIFSTIDPGTDPSQPGTPVDYAVSLEGTNYEVDAVRIIVDTDHSPTFEEIDSIQLRGVPAPDIAGARVISSTPGTGHPAPLDHIEVVFDEPIQAGSFDLSDVSNLETPSGTVAPLSVVAISDQVFHITFAEQQDFGTYSVAIGPDILDLAGNAMDQSGDGISGQVDDAFELTFQLELWQNASSVIDVSSQYSSTSWSAAQTLGEPDTFVYGDQRTAWAPGSANGTTETLTVGFDTAVLATGAIIRESFGNGFVRQVEVRNADTGDFEVVSTATDDSQPGEVVDYSVNWPMTEFNVDALRITVDTNHSSSFEEIDSVRLRGVIAPDVSGPRVVSTIPEDGHPGPIDRIELTFNEPIAPGTFTVDDIGSLIGPDGAIAVDSVLQVSETEYHVLFPQQDSFGSYSLVLGPEIEDLAGNRMDQNGNGLGGEPSLDEFRLDFEIELWQYASSVVDFSSQYSSTSWSAAQTLGAPDTFAYADSRTAWAPGSANGTTETLTVGFETPVLSSGVVIRETYGNGFVRGIDVRDADTGIFHAMPFVSDDSLPGTPVDFLVSWPRTAFNVDAVRITVDTNHSTTFEEIDSVSLRGIVAPDVTGPQVIATTPDTSSPGPIDRIDLVFSEPIDESSFTPDDVISLTGPAGPIAVDAVQRIAEDRYEVLFASQTQYGTYELTLGPDINDLAGNLMDQDADGINGEPDEDRFVATVDLELWQDATSVIDFSSQYSSLSWSAAQTLGAPDTFVYADSRTAWAPSSANGTVEHITVGFDTPVRSTGAVIRETYGNGFVTRVEVRNAQTGSFHEVFAGVDSSQPGTPVDFVVSWPKTTFDVDAIRITIDTNTTTGFEEIDSVRLRGVTAP